MKIKICGITKEEEIQMLNEACVDYAGFVFYEKSKRNISVEASAKLKEKLSPSIKSVAVTVSPDADLVDRIEAAGFDIIQVHKELNEEVIRRSKLPIWRAVNIKSSDDIAGLSDLLNGESEDAAKKIEAVVVDAPEFGSGKTFDWSWASFDNIAGVKFVLAGGLTAQNVAEGIRIFDPDIVDVSSSVEGDDGKDRNKINEFVNAVRSAK